MRYTEEQMKRYLDILHNYTNQTLGSSQLKCINCQRSNCFSICTGYNVCENCGVLNGHVWGILVRNTMIDYFFERRVFIRESIIMRKRLIKFLKDYG